MSQGMLGTTDSLNAGSPITSLLGFYQLSIDNFGIYLTRLVPAGSRQTIVLFSAPITNATLTIAGKSVIVSPGTPPPATLILTDPVFIKAVVVQDDGKVVVYNNDGSLRLWYTYQGAQSDVMDGVIEALKGRIMNSLVPTSSLFTLPATTNGA